MTLLLRTTFYGLGCAVLAMLFLPAVSLPQTQKFKGVKLAISLKAPSTVNGVNDFTITVTLENKGTQDILVVKDPNGILYDFFAADALDFKKVDLKAKDVKKPIFVGYTAKWDMKTYLQDNSEEDDYLPDDHRDVVSLTAGSESHAKFNERRQGSSQNSDELGSLSDTDTSVGVNSEAGKIYPPGTTIDLPAGKKVAFNYNVGHAYNFSDSGAGAYTVKIKRDYFYVLVDDAIVEAEVDVKESTINVQGELTAEIPEPEESSVSENDMDDEEELAGRGIVKRARRETRVKTRGCGKIQTSTIDIAAQHADRYVAESKSYISAMTGPTDRYEHWFGKWDTPPDAPYHWRPRDQVSGMYDSLGRRSFLKPGKAGGYTYNCRCKENIHAYIMSGNYFVAPKNPVIHLCKAFRARTTPIRGPNSKAGTLIHEATHFAFRIPSTEDHEVGQSKCHELARDNAFRAATNADNYEFFSENSEPVLA